MTSTTASGARGVILLRLSDRNVAAKQRFKAAATALQLRVEGAPVVAAYLRSGALGNDLTLGQAVAQLVERGARDIAVVPYEVEMAYPEVYDLPDLLNDLAEEYPGVSFRQASPLALGDDLVAVAAGRLEQAWTHPPAGEAGPREVAAIAGQTPLSRASLPPGALPRLPAHAQHVFVCFGRRCLEEGSADTYRALSALLAEKGLDSGPDRVKLSRSKCLSPCQAAPMALCYPSGTFYAQLTAPAVPAFVEQSLVAGGELPGHSFKAGE
jgi:(2Fe-2S) ferredoxin/sirohydrochlorin ferrochelatase